MLPSELTNTIEQFIVYVHRNEAHFTNIYVYNTNVFQADNIKNTSNVISPIFVCNFFHVISLYFLAIFFDLGSTHDSTDCWSAHRSPAARESFKRVHDLCKAGWHRPSGIDRVASTGWHRPGAPKQKSYAFKRTPTVHIKSALIMCEMEVMYDFLTVQRIYNSVFRSA